MVTTSIPVSAINGLSSISNDINQVQTSTSSSSDDNVSFDSMLKSGMKLLEETNNYQLAAEEATLDYAMGYNDNIHDLSIAQQKAYVSLQYTVQVRNAVVEAYREIRNMQM